MKKGYLYCYMLLVVFLLGGFGLYALFSPVQAYSENENRYLDEYPSFSLEECLDRTFQNDFSSAFSDQFPGRDVWMKAATQVKKIEGFRDISGVYLGKDGYYFAKTTQDDIDQKQYLKNLRYAEYLGEVSGGGASLLLAPSPAQILPGKLPEGAPYYDGDAMVKMANTVMKQTKYIDARSSLREYAKQNQVYFRTDHHWTALGAYAAYSAYCVENKMEQHTYGYFDVQRISDSFLGSMYSKVLDPMAKRDDLYAAANTPQAEVVCDGEKRQGIYDVEQLMKKDKYAYFLGGNYGEVRIKSHVDSKKKMLVVKDSFANCFVPYLMEDYGEIIMIDLRYYKKSVQKLLQEEQFDNMLILYEMSNFAQDTNLYKLVH